MELARINEASIDEIERLADEGYTLEINNGKVTKVNEPCSKEA